MNVLLLSAELAPFAKAGGLADVAGSLPLALKEAGIDVRVMIPAYPMVLDALGAESVSHHTSISSAATGLSPANVLTSRFGSCSNGEQIPLYLIEDATGARNRKPYFSAAKHSSNIYSSEPEPYVFLARAACAWLTRYSPGWLPDVVHCNDWHTGLLPLLLQEHAKQHSRWLRPATLFTIHNLAYQGDFPASKFACTGLSRDYYGIDGVEFYGRWTFMKAALNCSDFVNTVSPTYAREILLPENGCGLDGLLRKLDGLHRLSGILNGIDATAFNPLTDKAIAAPYAAERPAGKLVCREALQRELNLNISSSQTIVGMVTRFAEQKGFDILAEAAGELMDLPIQLAVLGDGDPKYQKLLMGLQEQFPGRVSVTLGYNAELAQRIYAGSDLFLMPSRFEPCGLGQLIAMRYGTLPVVRATGGLSDTVRDISENPESGSGFLFKEYSGQELLNCLKRALAEIGTPSRRTMLSARVMYQDFSWHRSASEYIALYRKLCDARNA
jgi:starch synthase